MFPANKGYWWDHNSWQRAFYVPFGFSLIYAVFMFKGDEMVFQTSPYNSESKIYFELDA